MQPNVEIARRGYDAFNRRDMEAVLEIIDPDVELDEGRDLPDRNVYRTHEGFLASIRSWQDVFDELRFEPEEFIEAGIGFSSSCASRGAGREAEPSSTSAKHTFGRCVTGKAFGSSSTPIERRPSERPAHRRKPAGLASQLERLTHIVGSTRVDVLKGGQMGFDQYHEPPDELPSATRTFARLCASLTEEAEAIGWYEQRLAVEPDAEAQAVMRDAQGEEFKHFSMDLELLLRRTPVWREIAAGVLFQDGNVVEHAERAEAEATENGEPSDAAPPPTAGSLGIGGLKGGTP
jgi:hypothetical protein